MKFMFWTVSQFMQNAITTDVFMVKSETEKQHGGSWIFGLETGP